MNKYDYTLIEILYDYCKNQGIELSNMDEIEAEIANHLDSLIPKIIHEFGNLVK